MKIVVIGDGKVGRNVIHHLADEGHNIVVIDNDPKVVEDCINTYDVQGICGNGASYDVQVEAGVDKADLLISVTTNDEMNILCCLVAKKIGAKQTIARVRNPEYSHQIYMMREELGLSMTVNPELDSATEITRMLRFPSAIKIDTFANGKVDLVEIKLEDNSPFVGKTLFDIHTKYQINFLICAVVRGEEVFIPKGKFTLEANDRIYLTANILDLTNLFKKLDILKEKIKDVIIIGGGKVAYYLIPQLDKLGIKVKVIEKDANRCLMLSEAFKNAMIVNGDGTDQSLMLEEGIESCDAVISLTGMDEENIIMSMFAQTKNDGKIITKVNRASYSAILQTAGLDSIISPKDISTNHIIRYVRGMKNTKGSEFRTLYRLVNNKVEALEFYISKETKYTNKAIKDLKIKDDTLIAAIIREGNVIIPSGMDMLLENDSVIVITTKQINDLADVF